MSKHHKKAKHKSDSKDPSMKEKMQMKSDTKSGDKGESSMDGPHLIDPGEGSNKSQDEGKIYDL